MSELAAARPAVGLQRKYRNLKEYLHDTCINLLHSSGEVHVILEVYTCQLFLRYRREIFILGVLGFLKTTRSFPKIPEEFRSLPKKSEVFRRRLKSSKFAYCDESENSPRISQSQS